MKLFRIDDLAPFLLFLLHPGLSSIGLHLGYQLVLVADLVETQP